MTTNTGTRCKLIKKDSFRMPVGAGIFKGDLFTWRSQCIQALHQPDEVLCCNCNLFNPEAEEFPETVAWEPRS